MRTCNECQKEYPLTLEFFHKHVSSKGGFNRKCKTCANEIKAEQKRMREGRGIKVQHRHPAGPHLRTSNIENYNLKVGQRYKIRTIYRETRTTVVAECIANFKTFVLFQIGARRESFMKVDLITKKGEVFEIKEVA